MVSEKVWRRRLWCRWIDRNSIGKLIEWTSSLLHDATTVDGASGGWVFEKVGWKRNEKEREYRNSSN